MLAPFDTVVDCKRSRTDRDIEISRISNASNISCIGKLVEKRGVSCIIIPANTIALNIKADKESGPQAKTTKYSAPVKPPARVVSASSWPLPCRGVRSR